MKKQLLNGDWLVFESKESGLRHGGMAFPAENGESRQFSVTIPGSVLSALVDGKVIEDPYYRCNEYETRELFRRDFTFCRSFTVTEELLEEERLELVCEGIDTLAKIYVNDQLVGNTINMHRTWRFDVKGLVVLGENTIRIEIAAPIEYMENYQPAPGKENADATIGAMTGNQYIRKAHSMFGWDWGAQLPDEGIWRDIYLEAFSKARITGVKITQQHPEYMDLTSEASEKNMDTPSDENKQKVNPLKDKDLLVTLFIDVDLEVVEAGRYKLSLTLTPSWKNGQKLLATTSKTRTVLVNEGQTHLTLEIPVDEAKLWWPNGLGDQNLYDLALSLKPAGVLAGGAAALAINKVEPLDTKTLTIGLRTFSICRDKNEWGEDFSYCINGQKFFAMGANYIPEDCIYSHITESRQDFLISSAVKAHYNTMRVWGGGYYPSDYFYDQCDKYGLIVWQDLMFACNIYELSDDFRENITQEIIDNVRRLRHHASLGVWCGNNEMESAWLDWGWLQKAGPYLKADYIKQFEDVIPSVVEAEDGEKFFWPSSPCSGGCFDNPCNPDRGDVHYWAVWHGMKPFSDYLNHYFRFCSEFGFQSFPSYKTVESFTLPEDRNIFSQVMESHQKNPSANTKLLTYLSENFRYPERFDKLLYNTQILQAEAIKTGVDHWRRNRERCRGAIYWQMNDNWPVASWASIDYYNRWKPLHYYAARFFAPRTGSLLRTGEELNIQQLQIFSGVEAHFTNETFEEAEVTVSLRLKTLDFKVLNEVTVSEKIAPFSAKKLLAADYEDLLKPELTKGLTSSREYSRTEVFVEAEFTYEEYQSGKTITQVESLMLVPCKYMEMEPAQVAVDVKEVEDAYEISLYSDIFAPYISLDLSDSDAVFSDNCINLTSKEPRTISLKKSDIFAGEVKDVEDLKRQLQILTL